MPAAAQTADIVITNAKVWTGNPAQRTAEAVAITGDRITLVGSNAAVTAAAGDKTRRIDALGRVVIPGFNDAHTHQGALPEHMALSLVDDPTWPDIRAGLVNGTEESAGDVWITGTIGAKALRDPAITARALDEATHGRKVVLTSWTGHGGIWSTAALRALRVSDSSPDPIGGWFERDSAGRLTGKAFEYAQFNLHRKLNGDVGVTENIDALRNYADEALRLGITSVQNMSLTPIKAYDAAMRRANLPLRVRMIRFPGTDATGRDKSEGASLPFADRERPLAMVSGMKWILDGTPIEQNAATRTAYPNTQNSGRLNFTPEELKQIATEALASKDQTLLHVAGDRTAAALFDAMKAVGTPEQWRAKRLRVEHGDGLLPDLIPIAKELGVVVVLNPTHFFAAKAYPQGAYLPAKSLLKAGIPIAIGSDGPMNPGLNVQLAAAHAGNPAESLTREETIDAYTRGSAYAEFAENDKGTIAPGKLADVVVLSQNIFTVSAERLPETASVLTIVNGKVVYQGNLR
jgi:predicted amidohydrolase YtcJ